MLYEACALADEVGGHHETEPAVLDEPAPTHADVPVPEDYEATRGFLEHNPELVDLGIQMVMDAAGTACERSTAQGIIDHLQDMLDGAHGAPVAMSEPVLELPGGQALAIKLEARRGSARLLTEDSISAVEERLFAAIDDYVQVMDEELGYNVPLYVLRRQVDDLVGSAFAQFEADQKAEEDLRS